MKKQLLILCFCMAIICHIQAQLISHTLTHDGEIRTYQVYLPTNYQAGDELPLVINMHGFGSNILEQVLYANFNGIADTENFIICYPQGLVGTTAWQATDTHWNSYFGTGVDDMGFIDKLIDQVWTDYGVNLARVYSTGMSNGGYMSYRLACEMSDRIAAIASVTGAFTFEGETNCTADRPVPVLQIHGTLDLVVPYNGTPLLNMSIPEGIDFWVQKNNCNVDAKVTTQIDDTNMADLSTVSLDVYPECDGDTEVHFYTITNGGHTWPGSFPVPALGNTNQDIAASPIIWDFFNRFVHPDPKEGTLVNTATIISDNQLQIFPNPFKDQLFIKNSRSQEGHIRIIDVTGKIIFERTTLNAFENLEINIPNLINGIYFLTFESEGQLFQKKLIRIE